MQKKLLKITLQGLIIVFFIMLWSSVFANNASPLGNAKNPNEVQFAPGEVLVKFKQSTTRPKQELLKDKAGVRKTLEKIGPAKKQSIELLELDSNTTVNEAVLKLENKKEVEYAEPNYRGFADFSPNDTFFTNQWGLNNTGQIIDGEQGIADADIDMPEAWQNIGSISKTSVIAVLDSGIDFYHPDLSANIWQNSDEIADDNTDNDANGYVDDIKGFNWADISQSSFFGKQRRFGSDNPDPAYSDIAQTFVGNGGTINKIAIRLKKNGSPSDGISISLRSERDGAVLASADIAAAQIGTSAGWIEKSISPATKVVADTTYYLVIHTDNADALNNYDINYNLYGTVKGDAVLGDAFADGYMALKSGTMWTEELQDDIDFRLSLDSQKNGKGGGIPRDDVGHGTHITGIAAAKTNNNEGIASVAGYPENAVKIMPLRVLDSQGAGLQGDWANAVYYATDNGADVINMSLSSSAQSQTLQDAVNYAVNNGVVVIASAGNNGGNAIRYPAGLENVIGVSATTNTDALASISNYNAFVDLSAPGQDIYSTTPTYQHYFSSFYARRGLLSYDFRSGTSMAVPAVSGVAALIKSKWPTSTPAQIQELLQNNADDLGDAGRDDYFGYGRVNAVRVFDTTPPTLTVTSLSPDPTNRFPIATIFTFSEAVKDFEASDISVDNGTVQNFSGSGANYTADIIPASNGNVFIDVGAEVAQDEAGNSNTAADRLTRTYCILAPSVPGTPATANTTNDNTPTWNWNASTDSGAGLNSAPYTVQWSKDPLFLSGVLSSTSSTNSFTHSQALGEGTWYFRVNAKDTLDNTSAYSSNGSVVVDLTPPTILQILATRNNSGYVRGAISLNTNVGDNVGVTNVSYYLDSLSNLIDTSNLNPYSVGFNTATASNGNHNILLYAYDGAGNSNNFTTQLKVDNYKPKTYARKTRARRVSRKKAPRYLRLYRFYRSKRLKTRNKRTRKLYKRRASKYLRAYRDARRNIATAKIGWKVRDPYTGNKAYVKLKIQKRIKSKVRARRKARYKKLYLNYKKKYQKNRNRRLKRRYKKLAKRYFRAYRRTKTIIYKTVKVANYRWTSINKWRSYTYRTRSKGTYKIYVYAKDQAGNNQSSVARNALVIN